MEKLQPVIKQMFWILFSLSTMLVTFGWWSASAHLDKQISDRKKAVTTAIKEGGQNVSNVPNEKWTSGAQEINRKHERSYRKSASRLYRTQYTSRTFPEEISEELSQLDFNGKIEKKSLREHYGTLYADYFESQLKVIRPFRLGEGVVDVSKANITKEDYLRWENKRPTSAEIWNAQEDIWLLRSLFDSIAAVNEGFDRIDQAPLRSLSELTLRGGDRNAPISSGGGGAAAAGVPAGFTGSLGRGREENGGRQPVNTNTGGGSAGWAAFEGSLSGDLLTEEFGGIGGTMAAASGAGGRGGGKRGRDDDSGGWGGGGGWEDEPAASPVTEPSSTDGRYVDDETELPYRTRAFHLKVRILQQEVPKLLAELTNSKFPVEIVRVDAAFGGDSAGRRSSPRAGGRGGGGDREDRGERRGGFGGGGFGGGGRGGIGRNALGGGRGKSRAPGGLTRSVALTPKQRLKVEQGGRLLEAGLADTALCTLRVAGLMTLYRTAEENSADEETEAGEAAEVQEDGDAPLSESGTNVPETGVDESAVKDEEPLEGEPPNEGPASAFADDNDGVPDESFTEGSLPDDDDPTGQP